jgi:cysteine desulfurase
MNTLEKMINFDYNATAPVCTAAREEVMRIMDQMQGNPSSVHAFGRHARNRIESARLRIAEALSVDSKNIIFTSGATESNAMVLRGFKGPILVSAIEHSSILDARDDVTLAPVDENGSVHLGFIEKWLSDHHGKSLVSIMSANNETGVIQPVAKISELCKRNGAFFHSDAVQAIGRTPLNMGHFDCVSISAHKLGGLPGTGCVIIKDNFPIQALFNGGGQERSYRAGTENITGIVAFAAALEEAVTVDRLNKWRQVAELCHEIKSEIKKICAETVVMGENAPRLPNTICITMPNVKAETQVLRFDLEGIAVSAGAACSSGKIRKSRVLAAMGVSEDIASTAIRISLTDQTTKHEVETFVSIWKRIYHSINNNQTKARAA